MLQQEGRKRKGRGGYGHVRQHGFGQKRGSLAAQNAFDALPADKQHSKHWPRLGLPISPRPAYSGARC